MTAPPCSGCGWEALQTFRFQSDARDSLRTFRFQCGGALVSYQRLQNESKMTASMAHWACPFPCQLPTPSRAAQLQSRSQHILKQKSTNSSATAQRRISESMPRAFGMAKIFGRFKKAPVSCGRVFPKEGMAGNPRRWNSFQAWYTVGRIQISSL